MHRIFGSAFLWMICSAVVFCLSVSAFQSSVDSALYNVFFASYLYIGYAFTVRYRDRRILSDSTVTFALLGFLSLPRFTHTSGAMLVVLAMFFIVAAGISLYVHMTLERNEGRMSRLYGLSVAFAFVMATTPVRLLAQSNQSTYWAIAVSVVIWALAALAAMAVGKALQFSAGVYERSTWQMREEKRIRPDVVPQ